MTLVDEAIERAQFEDRIAIGTVDGEDVLVSARISDYDRPKFSVHAGGANKEDGHLEFGVFHAGGVEVSDRPSTVADLEQHFKRYVETYDFDVIFEGE